MKILSRILVTLLVLLGTALLIMLGQAYAADEAKCQGWQLWIGLDEKGCEKVNTLHRTEDQIDATLAEFQKGEECYRIRSWEEHCLKRDKGKLDLVLCAYTDDAQTSPAVQMFQPLGTSQTQRIMFKTPAEKDAFISKLEALPEPSPLPSPVPCRSPGPCPSPSPCPSLSPSRNPSPK